jgi:hypothetical protein
MTMDQEIIAGTTSEECRMYKDYMDLGERYPSYVAGKETLQNRPYHNF